MPPGKPPETGIRLVPSLHKQNVFFAQDNSQSREFRSDNHVIDLWMDSRKRILYNHVESSKTREHVEK